MKRLGTVIGAGVLLTVLAACAGQETASPPQETTPAPPTSSATPVPPGVPPTEPSEPDRQPARTPPSGGTEVPAGQIDATGVVEDYPTVVWTENGGTDIGVVAQEGGCGKASAEVAAQDDTQVVITLVETQPAKPVQCTMDLRFPKLSVDLEKPLGERKVVLKSEQRVG
ncbi:hypothetical protein JOD54_006535 [Actinokineospora baliensis]|uniref:hypothetical protein n=1 Tax=Actinokineospora baliensis TaxID=547056 RepID=UPI00195F00C5|nr:hypothetical protein [Actinokineospora baliensis]MBM7776331.1 hypothetical protein [Actinokineospora baliensis]